LKSSTQSMCRRGYLKKSDSKEGVAARRSHKSVLAREEIDCA
jgi:hypothetical protein